MNHNCQNNINCQLCKKSLGTYRLPAGASDCGNGTCGDGCCVRCGHDEQSIFQEKVNYERDYSHVHCWNQESPACGQPLEKHKQCCLCDLPSPEIVEKKKCKIDSHIPTENGEACECGYFIKDYVDEDINIKDGIY